MTNNPFNTSRFSYNRSLSGRFGEMGSGGGIRVLFVQAALEIRELKNVKLIASINGSEKWPVRDLFQREVDNNRVTKEIVPYLRDSESIKFFNPLTLVALPLDDSGSVERELPIGDKIPDRSEKWEF
jgi:hypothetical protein